MHPIDIAVILVYLLGMAGMGFWFMCRNRDADAYFMAGLAVFSSWASSGEGNIG